jgi:hypothetical protein
MLGLKVVVHYSQTNVQFVASGVPVARNELLWLFHEVQYVLNGKTVDCLSALERNLFPLFSLPVFTLFAVFSRRLYVVGALNSRGVLWLITTHLGTVTSWVRLLVTVTSWVRLLGTVTFWVRLLVAVTSWVRLLGTVTSWVRLLGTVAKIHFVV